jgi:hypothetical protein
MCNNNDSLFIDNSLGSSREFNKSFVNEYRILKRQVPKEK